MCISITLSNTNWLCQPHAIFLGTVNSKACLTVCVCRFLSTIGLEREKASFVRNNGLLKNTQLLLCWSFIHSRILSQCFSNKKSLPSGSGVFFIGYHGSWQHLQPWYHRRYLISCIPCILQMVTFIVFIKILIRQYCTKWKFITKSTFRALQCLVTFI